MSIRLEVVVSEEEYGAIRNLAREKEMTIAGWVRETLRKECRRVTSCNVDQKLAAIRNAGRHQYPTADIDQMLFEIRRDSCEDV